jgi:hypothetical protein
MFLRGRNRKGASRYRKVGAKNAEFYHHYLVEGKDLRFAKSR